MSFRSARLGRLRPGASAVLLASIAALIASGCGSKTVASVIRTSAITVDGTSISQKDFEHDLSALGANPKLKALDKTVAAQGGTSQRLFNSEGKPTKVLSTSWLNRLANQIVIDQEFKQLHLTLSAEDKKEGEAQFAQLFATDSAPGTGLVGSFPKWFQTQETTREARLVAVTRDIEKRHPITDADMRAFYKKNVGSLCPSGLNVSHILVKTLPEAQAIEAQLAAGAKFSDLATAKSIDTTSAQKGGSLGCFATGQFVPEFETAAQAAKPDVPTAPVKSQFGYHIILTSKFVAPAYETLKPQIRQQLLQELNLVQKFVSAGLKKAKVKVDPLYGTWNTKTYRVDAPKVPAVRNSRDATTTTS
jgi:peptidyl-prolyl cis-trans isomerase C